jgi:hypothetical protein
MNTNYLVVGVYGLVLACLIEIMVIRTGDTFLDLLVIVNLIVSLASFVIGVFDKE